jgi:hypothetical protein
LNNTENDGEPKHKHYERSQESLKMPKECQRTKDRQRLTSTSTCSGCMTGSMMSEVVQELQDLKEIMRDVKDNMYEQEADKWMKKDKMYEQEADKQMKKDKEEAGQVMRSERSVNSYANSGVNKGGKMLMMEVTQHQNGAMRIKSNMEDKIRRSSSAPQNHHGMTLRTGPGNEKVNKRHNPSLICMPETMVLQKDKSGHQQQH